MNSALPASAPSRSDRHGTLGDASGTAAGSRERASFRGDIEGLRGVAVLSLLAVHLFPQWVSGVFVGVDIFFVISGFLVSDGLFKAQDAHDFRLGDFYARRIRRIVPALSVVLFFCLVFSVLFTYPAAARQIGEGVITGAFFVSNLTLWQDALQLNRTAQQGPLTHLWWLGIEAQFCVVWPLAVALMFKHRRWALHAIVALVVASLLLSALLAGSASSAHLLLPLTRGWELMAGALLAYLMRYVGQGPVACLEARLCGGRPSPRVADAFGFGGLALLMLAVWLVDSATALPTAWAVLPTLGTVALLAAGPQAWVNRALLAHPVLRFSGAISFGLYLWHWPLLCFPAVLGMPLTPELRVIILTASVVLAALTFELVDRQAQAGTRRTGRPVVTVAVLIAVALGGWYVQSTNGLFASFPANMQQAPF